MDPNTILNLNLNNHAQFYSSSSTMASSSTSQQQQQQQQFYLAQQTIQEQKPNIMSHQDKGKKPKGRMSNYTFFVQMCREEHRKKHPTENVNFTEFSKKCAERWKQMTDKEKQRFAEMAERDKQRYEREMATYTPDNEHGRKKRKKDPNAPKRPLSAFFLFCQDERPAVKAIYPNYSVGEAAKELGERWNKVPADVKSKYEAKAASDKTR